MQAITHHLNAPPRELTHTQLARLAPKPPKARRVTLALDAFPEWPGPHQTHGLSDAEYWEKKAHEHIKTLTAAHLLHEQVTSGTTVPRSLSYALNAMQVEIGNRVRRAIRRHVSNGGTKEDALRQAWEQAA